MDQGLALRGIASAAIDVSDGLALDAGRMARASGVGVELDLERLPLSSALRAAHSESAAHTLALTGGDDYELLFTVSPEQAVELARVSRSWGCGCTRIGRIVAEPGVRARLYGRDAPLASPGFQHF